MQVQPQMRPRLLLIEDDEARILWFRRWTQDSGFVLVEARSAGQALGFLSKGSNEAVAGLLLDHDLSDSPFVDNDLRMSTSDLMPKIVRGMDRRSPVLIHSHNATKPPHMQRMLETAGFTVTRARFAVLDALRMAAWLEEVRDCWEDRG